MYQAPPMSGNRSYGKTLQQIGAEGIPTIYVYKESDLTTLNLQSGTQSVYFCIKKG